MNAGQVAKTRYNSVQSGKTRRPTSARGGLGEKRNADLGRRRRRRRWRRLSWEPNAADKKKELRIKRNGPTEATATATTTATFTKRCYR